MEDLTAQLRAWARRYDPRSKERTLFLQAAEQLEAQERDVAEEVAKRQASRITPEAVERAMGGRKLFPWQRRALEGDFEDTPPSSSAA